jgi:hypothetical protein
MWLALHHRGKLTIPLNECGDALCLFGICLLCEVSGDIIRVGRSDSSWMTYDW